MYFQIDCNSKRQAIKSLSKHKRYSKNVGIKAVQEAQASKAHYGASDVWVISNSSYTEAALTLAKSNRFRLIDRSELIDMMLQMNAPEIPHEVIVGNPLIEMICSRCGRKMVLRKGPKDEFYGCSSFPKCRSVQQIKEISQSEMNH